MIEFEKGKIISLVKRGNRNQGNTEYIDLHVPHDGNTRSASDQGRAVCPSDVEYWRHVAVSGLDKGSEVDEAKPAISQYWMRPNTASRHTRGQVDARKYQVKCPTLSERYMDCMLLAGMLRTRWLVKRMKSSYWLFPEIFDFPQSAGAILLHSSAATCSPHGPQRHIRGATIYIGH